MASVELIGLGLSQMIGATVLAGALVMATAQTNSVSGSLAGRQAGQLLDGAVAHARGHWGDVVQGTAVTLSVSDLLASAPGGVRIAAITPWGGRWTAVVWPDAVVAGAARIAIVQQGGSVPSAQAANAIVGVLATRGAFVEAGSGGGLVMRGPGMSAGQTVALPSGFGEVGGVVAHAYLTATTAVPDWLPRAAIPGLATPMMTDLDMGGNSITGARQVEANTVTASGTVRAPEVKATDRLVAPAVEAVSVKSVQ